MKDIKYRAWNKSVKKFTYFGTKEPNIEYTAENKLGMFLEATNSVYLSAYEEPQMYTGLNDENGKEVYEGDIIKDIDYGYMTCTYANGTFIWYNKDKFGIRFMNYVPTIRVIGDIYNNPELVSEIE